MAGVDVQLYLEDIAGALAQGFTTIRLYRDTAATGSFTTLANSAALIAGVRDYAVNDPNGAAGSFYRYTLYTSAGPTETPLGILIQPAALTMLRLRLEAAQEAGLGFASLCTADGGASPRTTLIDAALGDSGQDADFGNGGYIYRPSASASDRVRRIAVNGFAPPSGTWTVTRAWAAAPAAGESYHFFNACSPIDWPGEDFSWDRAIRNGLRDVYYRDFINLGQGTGTGSNRFSLAEHVPYAQEPQIATVYARTADSSGNLTDRDYDANGSYWDIETESGVPTLILQPPPATDESVIVELNRQYEELYFDTDVTIGPCSLAVRATIVGLYEGLNLQRKSKFASELQGARALLEREYAKYRPRDIVRIG